MKSKLFSCLVLIIIILLPFMVSAQGPTDPNDVMVPIDGGLGILLGAGVSYGLKKYVDKKNQAESEK